MRPQDQKVEEIARATGMLTTVNGRDSSQDVSVGDLGMTFQFQTPDEHAHVEIYKKTGGRFKSVEVYMESELDLEIIKVDYPQFFE